jgi:hypothetical protein
MILKTAASVCALARQNSGIDLPVGLTVRLQFSVPPVMAASLRFCWRCATSKAKASVTPAI